MTIEIHNRTKMPKPNTPRNELFVYSQKVCFNFKTALITLINHIQNVQNTFAGDKFKKGLLKCSNFYENLIFHQERLYHLFILIVSI